ncbi:MAG: MFS transporter [Sphingomonadales bacterium]
MQTAPKKVVNAWAMYDWANSAYNLVITSTIFPAYFEAIAVDNRTESATAVTFLGRTFQNSALYNYTIAVALLIVACLSPLLSAIADFKGNKKSFMRFFLTLGSLGCSGLFFFERDTLGWGLVCMILACVGFWASWVYYNSFLPEIAAPEDRDRISARGYAYGYVGSVLLQLICFVFVFMPSLVGGNDDTTIQFRICFLLVGLWWFGFGTYSLNRMPGNRAAAPSGPQQQLLLKGYHELRSVWQQLKQQYKLRRFLTAFFCYNMGVQTVMLVAAIYGKSELEIPTTNLIGAILIIQLIAIPGAFTIARVSAKLGNLRTLQLLVALWCVGCVIGYNLPVGGINEFYGLAVIVGFMMGGIQSLSRSTYSKLMPATKDTASYFSFYDVTEKIATVIGMFGFGYITELTGSQRNSVLALMVFFVLGFFLLIFTKAEKTESHALV